MKHFAQFYFAFSLLLGQFSLASEIWLQSQGASTESFQNYLSSGVQRTSWLRYSISQFETSLRSIDEALPHANLNEKPNQNALSTLEKLEGAEPWSKEALYYLRDYANHILDSAVMTSELRASWKDSLCRYEILLDEELSVDCNSAIYSLESFKKQNPDVQVLAINQKILELSQQTQVKLDPSSSYHWTFFSNKTLPMTVKGNPQDVLHRKIDLQSVIYGTCVEFSAAGEAMQLENSGNVYFSEDCQKPITDSGKSQVWYKKKQTLLWGLGLLAAGAYLYNKTVVVTLPSF